jgi:hypothetical protein
MTAAATKQQQRADALEIFRVMAEARVLLCANGVVSLQDAVDDLWAKAVRAGLVKKFGADEVQGVLAESFARWQYE